MAALLGEVTPTAQSAPTWAQALPSLFTAAAQYRQADKLAKINLQRIQQGLKPLEAEELQPGVKVGLDPKTRALIGWGIAGALALGFVAMRSKRGRA